MKKYNVYFEVFGHKLKHTIAAKNEEDARQKIKDKIIFHKIKPVLSVLEEKEIDRISKLFDKIFK